MEGMAMIFGALLYNETEPQIFRVQELTSPLTKWSCAEIQFLQSRPRQFTVASFPMHSEWKVKIQKLSNLRFSVLFNRMPPCS